MFGTLFLKRNKNHDIRFLDRETYRSQRRSVEQPEVDFSLSAQEALKVNFCIASETSGIDTPRFLNSVSSSQESIPYTASGFSFTAQRNSRKQPEHQRPSLDDEFITVDQASHKQRPPTFFYSSERSYVNSFRINDIDYEETLHETLFEQPSLLQESPVGKNGKFQKPSGPDNDEKPFTETSMPKLGVFSDSKIYSAFVKNELDKLAVDLKHFNHPATFSKKLPAQYDLINGWIIFLSSDEENDFLEQFLDRFIDKPALFLVPKLSRKSASRAISQFIEELMP